MYLGPPLFHPDAISVVYITRVGGGIRLHLLSTTGQTGAVQVDAWHAQGCAKSFEIDIKVG